MAKAVKKKKELTIEEKVAEALVPVEEQPYLIPKNWCWVHLGSVSTNQYGYTTKAVIDNTLPKLLRITDIQENGVDWKSVPKSRIRQMENIKKSRFMWEKTGHGRNTKYIILEVYDNPIPIETQNTYKS